VSVSVAQRFVGVAVVAVLVGTTSGCPRHSGTDALLSGRARTPAPSSIGSCDFDLKGSAGETAFFVLGMLDEYQGRRIVEDEEVVERFYCHETSVAGVFRDAIVKLAKEQGLEPSVRSETTQGCLISYRSKPIAERLNSCYQYQASSDFVAQGSDGTYRWTASASLGLHLFLRSDRNLERGVDLPDEVFHRRRALAYVAGAWTRYGHGADFVFANAQDKARLVAQLLTSLGCRAVRIESTFGVIPQTNVVKFEPTGELREWLQRSGRAAGPPNIALHPGAARGPERSGRLLNPPASRQSHLAAEARR
jgi:hypothetical protein